MHLTSLIDGSTPLDTVLLLIYTFFFGFMMCLVLRSDGSLVATMLVHATTDASGALMTQFPHQSSPVGDGR